MERAKRLQQIKEWKKKTNYSQRIKKERRDNRIVVLKHYSNSTIPHCICCRESILEFLVLDHINNGGNEHRKTMFGKKGGKHYSGNATVEWIIRNNFPPLFQVLCHNCNMAKGFYGECPHKSR